MEPGETTGNVPDESRASPAARKTGRKRSDHARRAIMQATTDLLLEVGYHRLTIEGVATRAKVGKTTVYRWWPTKNSLVLEAINGQLDSEPPQLTGDSRADIRRLIERMAAPFNTPIGRVLPALGADLADEAGSVAPLTAMLGPRRAANVSVLYAVASRGDLPHDLDPHLVLDVIAGTVMYRTMMGGNVSAALVDHLTDLVLDGKTPRAPQ